ncbi:hypothetical protein XENOCAPTIV_021976 [Xenoophorus captivus]|uniref:Uncharacterized protein n=1 Tax=Xenoophorus captivus TaxID=1517983 RepID=A0ABV0RUY9_9TELE
MFIQSVNVFFIVKNKSLFFTTIVRISPKRNVQFRSLYPFIVAINPIYFRRSKGGIIIQYPSILCTCLSLLGAGAYLQRSMGRRRGTPWTGRHSITGKHRHTHRNNHAHS